MQKQPIRRFISLFIIVSLLLSVIPGSWSVNAVGEETTQAAKTNLDLAEPIQENTEITETISPLNADTVPEIIGYEETLNKNHVQRLYSDEGEDLNKVVFLNADGTKTMYLYDFPVKYVDTNGIIRDVSLDIADTVAGFETASGSAVTTFATNMSDGISLRGNDVEISLVPLLPVTIGSGSMASSASSAAGSVASRTATRIDSKTIAYPYDAKTTIEYSLTYTGFKEDIVVSEYTGQTEYAFRLYTNGYALTEIDGSFYLVDEVGNIKATIGDIIIFTADERNNTFGQLVPTTIVENEQYLLTIVVDAEFLADEKTVYPIRIDPTIEIFYAEDNVGDIEDVTVCSGTTYSGTSGSLYVGLKSGAGVCRALMKFPIVEALPDNITIQSAYIKVRDLMCESTAMDIECCVFQGDNWSESSASWSSTNAGGSGSIGTHLCTVTMDYDIGRTFTNKHWYSFDITRAVQGWINGTYSLNSGIVFKMPTSHENGSTYTYRTIGSYNRSSNQPMGEITYTVNGGTVKVQKGSSITLSTSGIDGVVTSWTSSNTGIATVNSSGVVTGVSVGVTKISAYSGSSLQKTFTVRVLFADGVYWIESAIEGLYMTADSGSISNGAPVELHSLYSGEPNNLLQLWKICYLGNDEYSVRPMHKLDMALHAGMDWATLQTAGTNDAGITASYRWEIVAGEGGHAFMDGDTVLTYSEDADEDTPLIMDMYDCDDPNDHWTLTEISFPPSGIVFFDTNKNELCTTATIFAERAQTKTLAEMGLIVSVYSGSTNSQAVVWQSSNQSVATVLSVSGQLNTVSYGKAIITVTTIINSQTYTQSYTAIVCKKKVTLEVVYDSAYSTRYSGGYERVCNHLDALQDFYLEQFALGVSFLDPRNFDSYADQYCYSSPTTNCDHGVCSNSVRNENGTIVLSDYHHKNISNIIYRISLPATESDFKLAFIGHDVCDADNGVCRREHPEYGDPAYGVTSLPLGIMAIMNAKSTEAELRTTIHEVGHLFGAPDHNGEGCPSSQMMNDSVGGGFSDYCIYGLYKKAEAVTQSKTICAGCRAMIEEGIDQYH